MARSRIELWGLEVEAERLVRDGYSRAEVSRMLGVPATTLSGWALRHGWRKKDLEHERADEAIEAAVMRIGKAHGDRVEAREREIERRQRIDKAVADQRSAVALLKGPEEAG